MVKHLDQIVIGVDGLVSTTLADIGLEDFWRTKTATDAAVWWLQNPANSFQAITTSLIAHKQQ